MPTCMCVARNVCACASWVSNDKLCVRSYACLFVHTHIGTCNCVYVYCFCTRETSRDGKGGLLQNFVVNDSSCYSAVDVHGCLFIFKLWS